MRRSLLPLALTASSLPLLGLAAPAQALSCVSASELLPGAEHVFAGQVVAAEDDRVQMAVHEVWAGGPVVELVWLPVEEPAGTWMPWTVDGDGTLDDRSARTTWVVFTDTDLAVNACTVRDAFDEDARALRPREVAAPVRGVAPGVEARSASSSSSSAAAAEPRPSAPVVAATALGVAGAGLLGGLWARRRPAREL